MNTEAIAPLNYTSSANDDLRALERDCLHEAPYSAYVLRNVITLLENSVKFILPNCADFIAPEDLWQTHLDLPVGCEPWFCTGRCYQRLSAKKIS